MAKNIYCTKELADKLKAGCSAQMQNDDITGNNFASSFFGTKIIEKPDKWFKNFKTKDGKQVNWIEIDESKFKSYELIALY